jgi:hypothetical protein
LAAVTLADSSAEWTSAAMRVTALLAVAGLLVAGSAFAPSVELEALLLHATAPRRRSVAAAAGSAFLMPVTVRGQQRARP